VVSSTHCGLYVKEVLHLFDDIFYILLLSQEKKVWNANKLYSNLSVIAYLHRTFYQISLQTVEVRCHTESQIPFLML
jgi:hypothetical protein